MSNNKESKKVTIFKGAMALGAKRKFKGLRGVHKFSRFIDETEGGMDITKKRIKRKLIKK